MAEENTMLRVIPTSEFVKKIEELSEHCYYNDDPVVLTREGYGDLVVMGFEAYNKLLAKMQLVCDVADANARLLEKNFPDDDELIDQAMQMVHDRAKRRRKNAA
jgi:PHD/YefM family antitoxin component YafN of YafNO toxin-antitoxin module